MEVLAVIRASRPQFRSRHDKLAFAVHAFLLAQDYKLIATGQAAEDDSQDFTTPREEADIAGWNSLPDVYAFRYQDIAGRRSPLYVKALVVGDDLLVHWQCAPGGSQAGGEPASASLSTQKYTTDAASPTESYQNLPDLVRQLQKLFQAATAAPSGAGPLGAAQQAHHGQPASDRDANRDERSDPLREGPAGGGRLGYQPPRIPTGVGADDVVPPGFRPPGFGPSEPGLPGLMEEPPMRGGGMHVGPGHPMFGPGRMGGGVGPDLPGGGRSSLPPGARYDPINPAGLPGFNPDDFIPPGPARPHPDVMQPGPGRGTDWDDMFG